MGESREAEAPKAPWWIGLPASVGFGVMGAVAATFLPVWVQAVLFALGGIAVLWSMVAGAWHFGLIGRGNRRTSSGKRVPFADVVRRAALETEWALDYELLPYQWFRDLRRQVLDPFSTGQLNATGLYTVAGRPDSTAITDIPQSFWSNARFTVEFALASHQDVMVFDTGQPCAAVAEEITILESDLDRIWPKARRSKGRVPVIASAIREWKAEQEEMLPDRLEWAEYVGNQRQLERSEKRTRHSDNVGNTTYVAAIADYLLAELAGRRRYTREAQSEGGSRLETWRTKVCDGSQGLVEDYLKAISPEGLSHTQIASLTQARRRVSDFNANTLRLARNEDRDAEHIAKLFLQRAGETEKALIALRDSCKESE